MRPILAWTPARGKPRTLLRPVWQAGHNGHPQHKVNLVPVEVERTNGNPRGFWSRFLIVSTGTHPTDWELLANYQQI